MRRRGSPAGCSRRRCTRRRRDARRPAGASSRPMRSARRCRSSRSPSPSSPSSGSRRSRSGAVAGTRTRRSNSGRTRAICRSARSGSVHVEQSADSATAARLLAWAQTEQRRADRLTDSLAAALKRVPTRAPVVPPPAYRADTATARAYQAGYTAGFATGWSEAADSGAASLRTQRAAYRTVQDSLMHATAKLETARRAGVVFAEHGDSLLKVARCTPIRSWSAVPVSGPGVPPEDPLHLRIRAQGVLSSAA
jgi:hypothetical protein